MVEVFGEPRGCRMFRKVAPWDARTFGPAIEFKKRIGLLSNRADFDAILTEFRRWRLRFLDEEGNLLSRYRPVPLEASFMRQDRVESPGRIPVPKEPVEVW